MSYYFIDLYEKVYAFDPTESNKIYEASYDESSGTYSVDSPEKLVTSGITVDVTNKTITFTTEFLTDVSPSTDKYLCLEDGSTVSGYKFAVEGGGATYTADGENGTLTVPSTASFTGSNGEYTYIAASGTETTISITKLTSEIWNLIKNHVTVDTANNR